MKLILFFVFAFFLVGVLTIPTSLAQDAMPSWIKNNAGWWAENKIDDFTFAQGIGFLIKNKIIQIHDLPTTSDGEIVIERDIAIPSWIKNSAGWWASDYISDSDFLYGIKYLVENNIIKFQSELDFEETENIEKHLLDWDTIITDSRYAYDGSIRLQSKFFDYVDYTIKYNAATNTAYDISEPTLLEASVWLYQITGDENYLENAGYIANVIEEFYLYESGIVTKGHPLSKTVDVGEKQTNQEILFSVAKLALMDSNYVQLTKTLADAVIEYEINHETDLFYSRVTLEGEPLDRFMYISYDGSVGLESLLLAYEVTSDTTYLDQVKRTILAYWDLRNKDTNLIPSWVNTDTGEIKEPFMQQYGAGIFLKVLLHYYYLTEDEDVYKIIEDYTDAIVNYFWDGKTWNYRVNYNGIVSSDIIEANYGKLDDALFLVYDLNPARFQNAYDLAKLDYDFSFQKEASVINGLVIHSVKDDGSRDSVESMMTYAFIINQNPAVRLYQDTGNPEYIEDMKAFYEKVIFHHKREYGYVWGIDAYTLEDTQLGSNLNQRAVGMIGNKINLSFVPSDNVKIVWTKIGNFEITEPFIVHFNEPGRFNAITFDYEEKSIFFDTIENEGTVTFSGAIKGVLADGQNYSNFNENTLNTLEGKHNYKVTLMD
jgi:rhamnogalacturonyl hydrolase YesR